MSKEREKTETKLYRVYSMFENFAGRKDVRVNWFYLDRETPIVKYSEAINEFGLHNEYLDYHASEYVDELFDCSEANSVGYDGIIIDGEFNVEEIILPVDQYGERDGLIPLQHRGNRKLNRLSGYIVGPEIEGFDSPFPYWGYFNLEGTEPTEETLAKGHETGRFLMAKFLKFEGFDPELIPQIVSEKIGGLYDVYEYYVQRAVDYITIIKLRQNPYKLELAESRGLFQ